MTRLLLIDDEAPFVRALGVSLRAMGYDVDAAATGAAGLAKVATTTPDIIVLDLGLPDMDGLEVLEGLRAWTSVPVIVLSARHHDESKVAALDGGADDYVTKPFSMSELLARIRAALRRRPVAEAEEPVVETAHFRVDLAAKQVTIDGEPIRLTPTEWNVLELLVRNQGKLVSQRQLLKEVWGPQYEKETEYLRVYLAALRRKLEPQPSRPQHFITEPGMGYRFIP
ncbi:MAG TPA: response regulator [Acidimicrobiales bacterium]|jgi:two-component system KDP operon response regulator KdpE|nr:response regulator [Acidimicrobiales bacterium]